MVEQFTAKLPNPMTKAELMDGGMSEALADAEMAKRVFGHNVAFGEDGKPIEQGAGSPSHEARMAKAGHVDTPHKKALAKSEAEKLKQGGNANADVISAAVAAGVQAGLAAGKKDHEEL